MTWDDVCTIASALPLVTSATYHGYPALRVNGKFLARLSDDHTSVEFKSIDPTQRDMLLATQPDVFHLPANFHGRGLFARLSALNDETLRELLEERWRIIAPRTAVARYKR